MLYWALIFLCLSLIAAVIGFGGFAFNFAFIGQILFVVFLIMFLVSLLVGLAHRPIE